MSETQTPDKTDRKKLAVSFGITAFALVGMFFTGITVYDLTKSPESLRNDLVFAKLNQGYDLVCQTKAGMQLCMINKTADNVLGISANKVQIEYGTNPCLNIYLEAPDKQVNYYNVTESSKCIPSIYFSVDDGWKIIIDAQNDIKARNFTGLVTAEKTTFWWNNFWLI